jgi:hypothetical protein
MHGHRYRASGDGRKAMVVLLVVAAHGWLLTLRLPVPPSRDAPAGSPPMVVWLMAPAAPAPPVPPRARPDAAPAGAERHRAAATPPAQARGERAVPASPDPQPPSQPDPRPRIALPSDDPKARPLQMPPTLAERARDRIGEPAGSALQRGVTRAARPDCKDAYAGLVLLAIPALLVDSVRDDGCKW